MMENIWADQYNANYTSDPLTNWLPNQVLESYLKVTEKLWKSAWKVPGTGEEPKHVINAVRHSKISLILASTIPYFFA